MEEKGDRMKTFKKYLAVWWIASRASMFIAFANRYGAFLFLFGKTVRFGLFFFFLFLLASRTQVIQGYSTHQILFFYLTFSIIDIISQMLFREVYRFRPQIVTGNFDLVLSRPVNPLFRALMGGVDILDLITLPPLLVLTVYYGLQLQPAFVQIAGYILLLINGLIITAAFHIVVLAVGILTTAVDHSIMIYRDLVNLGRIPIDFYREPIRSVLTFVIPVAVMVTIPAKVLMGIFDWLILGYGIAIAITFFLTSFWLWHWALKNYASASS